MSLIVPTPLAAGVVEGLGPGRVGDQLLLSICPDLSPSSFSNHPYIVPSSAATKIHSRFCGSSPFCRRASASTLPAVDPGFFCSALQIRAAFLANLGVGGGPAIQDSGRESPPLSLSSQLSPVSSSMLAWSDAVLGKIQQHFIPAVVCHVS